MLNKLPTLILVFLSLLSSVGAFVYRICAFNLFGIFLSLAVCLIIFIILLFYAKDKGVFIKNQKERKKTAKSDYILSAFFALIYAPALYILIKSATSASIVSPWQVVPPVFFALYFILGILLALHIIYGARNNFVLLPIILFYFLSFAVALLVYKIGYGFDPHIHRATMELIKEKGTVEPKPFYYLGQYALIIILNKITGLPIAGLDKFLVPVLAAVFIPFFLFKTVGGWLENQKASLLAALFFLALPFSFFIVTTPQNLAFLFLAVAILLGLRAESVFDLGVIFIISLAALAVHPLAGIPAVILCFFLAAYYSDKTKLKKYYYILLSAASALALPAAFFVLEKNFSGRTETGTNSAAGLAFADLGPQIPGKENFILNFIYLYLFNIKFIIFALILTGVILFLKHRKKCGVLLVYFLMSASLFASFLLTSLLSFDYLINYERDDYVARILSAAALFSTPFILLALYRLFDLALKAERPVRCGFILFAAALLPVSLYGSYPRLDNYHNSHGYSTGENDIAAVRWIETDAHGENYIALADQQVSAAALRESGFKKYYRGDIFYYPIPTGAPLYQYYLDMVYKKPDKKTIANAMDFAGVKRGYFVLNKYWRAFPKILEEAKLEADYWREFGADEVYVFVYE